VARSVLLQEEKMKKELPDFFYIDNTFCDTIETYWRMSKIFPLPGFPAVVAVRPDDDIPPHAGYYYLTTDCSIFYVSANSPDPRQVKYETVPSRVVAGMRDICKQYPCQLAEK